MAAHFPRVVFDVRRVAGFIGHVPAHFFAWFWPESFFYSKPAHKLHKAEIPDDERAAVKRIVGVPCGFVDSPINL